VGGWGVRENDTWSEPHPFCQKKGGRGEGRGEVAILAWPLGISGEDGSVPGSLGQTYGRLHALEGLARVEEAPW
jgi:hypothetical protein